MPCLSCEDERGVCSQSGLPCSRPAGSVVGLALNRGSTSLPCLPESPREGESGVAAAVIWYKRQQRTHGLKGDNLPETSFCGLITYGFRFVMKAETELHQSNFYCSNTSN